LRNHEIVVEHLRRRDVNRQRRELAETTNVDPAMPFEEQRVPSLEQKLGDELVVGARRCERGRIEPARCRPNRVDVGDRRRLRAGEPLRLGAKQNEPSLESSRWTLCVG
jgi:hypothetical protein